MRKIHVLIALVWIMILAGCAGESNNSATNTNEILASDSLSQESAFTTFANYILQLQPTIENIDSAWFKYDELKPEFSQDEKDSSFFVMYDYYSRFEIPESESEVYDEKDQRDLEKKYGKAGFEIWYSEGYAFLVTDMRQLVKDFKRDLSPELEAYTRVLEETYIQITSDAGLVISWEELADLVLVCEDYLAENGSSKYSAKVWPLYLEEMNFLLWGLDNSPIIDSWSNPETPVLDPEVEKTYSKLISDKKHRSGSIIEEHLDWLKSVNYTYTYEQVKYLTEAQAREKLGF